MAALAALTALGPAVAAAMPAALRAQEQADARPPVDPGLFQDLSWRHLGPYRGGRSVAVAGVTSDLMTYYFGGVGSGVWKTTDAGQTWESVSDDAFGTSSVGAIAVAPSDPNVVYAGMGEHAIRGVTTSHGDGVYRSTDAGRTWTHLGLDGTRHIARIRVHPTDPDRVWVAAQGAAYGESEDRGVYRSLDGGGAWEKVLYVGSSAGASELALDPTNPRILYAAFWDHVRRPWQVRSGGEGSGLWKSTDGGSTWKPIDDGLPELMGKTAVDVSPADPDRLWAMIEADPGGGLYRSDDGGASWSFMTGDWTLRARPWYYTEVYADPTDENTVYVLSAPMTKSVDGGRTFTRVSTPHGDNHDLWINSADSRIMINANDGGANVSFNGGETWSEQDNQPTVQFYRVNTDHRFPYHVYGGQQDNSTVAIASQAPGGIGPEDWYAVGGCESAFPGFHKEDPRFVYAGCYLGAISEYDHRTRSARDVQAYPDMPVALQARDMKYRFNWNAPIFVSQHDPSTVYHAGNVLLRSRDRGMTWEEASPDLTRADTARLGYGGGPITNEGAGGEIWGTLAYAIESPLQEGLIWTGSDDGLVHVTRDGGETWTDVTPDALGEGLVNAIDPSPHDPATAWVAYTEYKANDFTPMAFRTTDYGETWTAIGDGFAPDHWVRVVREDPVRPGLLYAGTEGGVYVSFDAGARWQPLQLDLPLTPITDLQVQTRRNDLVASTGGWGFWVLDELSALQEMEDVEGEAIHLFTPRDAYRLAAGGGGGGGGSTGENPPDGAVLDFVVADPGRGEGAADEVDEGQEDARTAEITLDILDAENDLVRRYSTDPDEDTGEEELEVKEGMNRHVWDLRHADVYGVPDLYVFGSLRGRRVVPGTYTARLTRGEDTRSVEVRVLADPRSDATQADFQEQDTFLRRVLAETEALHRSVVQLGEVRDQVEAVLDQAEEIEGADGVLEAGRALADSLTAVEDSLVQWETYDGQTVLNAPSRINFQYIRLLNLVEGAEGGVTEGSRVLFEDLNERWWPLRDRLDVLLDEGIDRFNEAVEEAGVAPVVKPKRRRIVS